jgi:hypothetical protein
MKSYIGTKVIQAKPMTNVRFAEIFCKPLPLVSEEGYLVRYPDGYESWSPKEVFEQCYREVDANEAKLVIASLEDAEDPR